MKRLTFKHLVEGDDLGYYATEYYLQRFLDEYEFYHDEEIAESLSKMFHTMISIYVTKSTADTYFIFYGQNGNVEPFMVEFKSRNEIRSVFSIQSGVGSDAELVKGLSSGKTKFIADEEIIKKKLMSLRSSLGALLMKGIKV